ncbi:MAG: radical SAM protein [Candidatus Diapherotrites archaeon]|nr:radical SAM protein [Candidatus Diapherotrites archaeon]
MIKHEFLANSPEKISQACKQCMKGEELVLFVTGLCNKHCFYCPVSDERDRKDAIFANERPLKNDEDFESILKEAREQNALGMGITGGDPLVKVDRAVKFIKFMKKEFGKEFYIHLYTWGTFASKENIAKLEEAGLDEIRFHLFKDPDYSRIQPALESKLKIVVEVPCIPGQEKELVELVDFIVLQKGRISHINLNEFEFSDSNFDDLRVKGYKQMNENTYVVKGSRELALKILSYARSKNLNAHFCTVHAKTIVQINNRLQRRANNIKKVFETVNEGGLIEKAVIEGSNLQEHLKEIISEFGQNVYYSEKKNWLETSERLAKRIANKYKLNASRILEYPIYDPWDFEKEPITTHEKNYSNLLQIKEKE